MALLHAKKNFFSSHCSYSIHIFQENCFREFLHNKLIFSIISNNFLYPFIFSYNKRASYHLDKDIKVEDKAKRGELYNWQRDDVTRKCRFKRNHCVAIHVNNRIPFLRVFYYTTRLHLDFCTRNMVMQA